MSGSMRYDGQYVNVKRMGLALDGLIRTEYPGDFLQFIEMYTFAKPRHFSEVAALMPKPVTLYDPVVRLQRRHERSEYQRNADPAALHQHPARLAAGAKFLSAQDTPNRQIMLITDGLPTAHFEGSICFCSTRPIRARRTRRCARLNCAPARASRSTSSCWRVGTRRRKTCASPTGWRSPPRAASSSRPAASWTATSSGITSRGGSRLSLEAVFRFRRV